MPTPIGGRGHAIYIFKQFYKVGGIRERALVANLGNGFRCGNQQQPQVHQALADKPLVGRKFEMAAKLLFEGGERTIGQSRELLNGDVAEDMFVDDLLEELFIGIDITQTPP